MSATILFILLFALMFLGVPIAIALGLSSLLTIIMFGQDSLASLALKLFETSEHYTLMAIPYFILGGALMSTGGVAKRLIRFAIACVGHIRGGLAIAAVLACTFFAAVSGSSPATVVAIGSIMIAGMVKAGYGKDYAAGILCNAGTLGILMPPSIVMVVYCSVTELSVGRIFIAGVIPAILLAIALMVAIYISARVMKIPAAQKASAKEFFESGKDAIWGFLLLVIIMGGIYGGVFTPTEAAAVAALYALLVSVFIYRDIKWRNIPEVFKDASKTTVMLMFIIANAMLFAHVLTTERIPQIMAEQILAYGMPPWAFLIVMNIILLIAGNFMEPTAIILILGPLFFHIATQLGIDPIHLGIIMVVNMEIGMITPPVGLNLFVTSGITGMPLTKVVRAAMPWLGVLFLFLIVITYVPSISTYLPNLIMGKELS
ncbi:TRAP transporter large permease [Polynucleobacter sp. AP-Jannik-300A-C4]|uniref:TRAP transporter large permease n=1 Tax=Polynucleobacter sp. AP-Jannik-300A-C4 TaxID=2576928 RepID=UPI001BFDFADA|nr:TRAP transporter large permease [Polynucleobacter sp. AP-Jannik-300A-C4]QWE23342.1 TRAP transporter large permease [Polynucleobacter sp. AP-Jannik-300A-C4]